MNDIELLKNRIFEEDGAVATYDSGTGSNGGQGDLGVAPNVALDVVDPNTPSSEENSLSILKLVYMKVCKNKKNCPELNNTNK